MRNFLFAFLLILIAPSLYAAEVIKVKGKSVLVELKGDPAVAGDNFYLISPDGKKRGIIKISKVKGDKAIGKLTKGKGAPGYTLEFKAQKAAAGPSGGGSSGGGDMAAPSPQDGSTEWVRSYWGAIAGISVNTMNVRVTGAPPTNSDLGTVNMSGNGFSLKGLFDYELFNNIWFRGTTGVEMFNAAGGTICGSSNNAACNAKLTYLTFDFIGRYVFGHGNFRPWVGAGLGLLFPAQKEATALDPQSISTTNVLLATGGVDWFINPRMYIPVQVEYGLLPKSEEVEANWIAVRAGVAWPF